MVIEEQATLPPLMLMTLPFLDLGRVLSVLPIIEALNHTCSWLDPFRAAFGSLDSRDWDTLEEKLAAWSTL